MFGFGWLKKVKTVKREALPVKDRNDRKKCKSSTDWENESYCPYCFNETTHKERMTDICLSCGRYDSRLCSKQRVSRKIWSGKSWLIQRSYRNELLISGEEWRYEKKWDDGYSKTGKIWIWRTFDGDGPEVEDEHPEFQVRNEGWLFIYKKELIE